MSSVSQNRALVLGLGASGVGAALLLHHQGFCVVVNDRATEASMAEQSAKLPRDIQRVFGHHPLELLTDCTMVVVSPGLPWDMPLLVAARKSGIETLAEAELAARSLKATPIAGITGSNGKTTVTSLLGEIVKTAGWRTGIGGNIGKAASELALEGPWDAVVLELSSYQLEGCTTLRPKVAVLTNLSPDHLDRHPTMEAYLAAKARIFAAQTPSDWAVLNADDPALAAVRVRAKIIRFSLLNPTAQAHLHQGVLVLDGQGLIERAALKLLGDHNVANALAAALAAARMGVPREAIARALAAFQPLAHRHELVAEARGVRWVDDSKGTNIGATAAGLAGYPSGTVHLILGGLGKGQDFTELRPGILGRLARIYLIGEAAAEIGEALAGAAPIEHCGTLETAMNRANAHICPGDTVLLSPACASFDQFRDYKHRGEEFARLAQIICGGGHA